MFRNKRKSTVFVALIAVLAALTLAAPAFAGGWVVITLDSLPKDIIAGTPYAIGMVARQHGQTAWEADSLQIQAEHVETGTLVEFTALPEGDPGHYVAEVVFPTAGEWEWGISAGMFPAAQPMPALNVAESQSAAAGAPETSTSQLAGAANPLTILLGAGALLAFAAGLLLIVRAQSRRYPVLAGAGLLVLCAGLAFASYSSARAQAKQAVPATGADTAAVENPAVLGQQLFLAKGCVVCHTNDRAIKGSASYGTNAGPNLTSYKNDPNYIHTKLKDPKAMNPAAQMPQLDLKVDEIEALVAFINDHE